MRPPAGGLHSCAHRLPTSGCPLCVPIQPFLKTLHPLGANAASSCCLLCLRFDLHLSCEGLGTVWGAGGLNTIQAGTVPWRGGVGPMQGQHLT